MLGERYKEGGGRERDGEENGGKINGFFLSDLDIFFSFFFFFFSFPLFWAVCPLEFFFFFFFWVCLNYHL